MTRKAYVDKAPDKRNAKMNDALAIAVIAENTEITQGTEVQTNSHKITQNPLTGTATSNHRVETVHHTQDQIFKLTHNTILDHNHLTLTIIEMEIAHKDRSLKKPTS